MNEKSTDFKRCEDEIRIVPPDGRAGRLYGYSGGGKWAHVWLDAGTPDWSNVIVVMDADLQLTSNPAATQRLSAGRATTAGSCNAGRRMGRRKLTAEQVAWARREAHAGRDVASIAIELGMSRPAVWRAVTGQTYSDVADWPPLPVGRHDAPLLQCVECGAVYHHRQRWKYGRCNRCYLAYLESRRQERPDNGAATVNRAGWQHCPRCTILTPGGGLCVWCEQEIKDIPCKER